MPAPLPAAESECLRLTNGGSHDSGYALFGEAVVNGFDVTFDVWANASSEGMGLLYFDAEEHDGAFSHFNMTWGTYKSVVHQGRTWADASVLAAVNVPYVAFGLSIASGAVRLRFNDGAGNVGTALTTLGGDAVVHNTWLPVRATS